MRTPKPRLELARSLMILGFGLLATSTVLAVFKAPFFRSWYFLLAAAGYILSVDGWVHRHRGESLLISYPRRFLFLCGWSVVFWALHEVLNFRLGLWHYVDFPESTPLRWAAHVLAFATVVPAVLETGDLVESAGLIKAHASPSLHTVSPSALQTTGAVMVGLALAAPAVFFPLAWAAPLFLFDPWNERRGDESLLTDWRTGRDRRLILLGVAGLFCGFLWQGANLLSGARWEWTFPAYFQGRIFGFPVLGYLLLPFFAAGVFSSSVWAVRGWERSRPGTKALWAGATALILFYVLQGLDRAALPLP